MSVLPPGASPGPTAERAKFGPPLPAGVEEAARTASASVDTEGRFPFEAFEALRAHKLLGALVPAELGGAGASLGAVAANCQALAAACGSAGMVLAMHHIQVACIARHAVEDPWHADFLRRLNEEQLLLASSTSEVGTGGNLRNSICAIESEGDRFTVLKQASAISYGAQADAILVTARAGASAPQSDQVLAVVERSGLALERTSTWDAMGMRGTGSEGYRLSGQGALAQVVSAPFAEIAGATMVPVSHILWAAVWTGIAGDAVKRARKALRARRKPTDTELSGDAVRLAGAVELLQMAEARLRSALERFDWDRPTQPSFAAAAYNNGLKTSVADTCLMVAQEAMSVCGFAGYARQGEFSVSRHLRDLHSAPLMIGNGRMREAAAHLILAQRPDFGLS